MKQMCEFNRGIKKEEFIKALNQLYKDESSFWYKVINDKELFVAIRDNYINVYYNGQCICLLKYSSKGSVIGKTHGKYLGIDENKYITSENGEIFNENSKIKFLSDINQIKENIAIKHIGKEKGNSYTQILNSEKFILDVEITLVKKLVENPIKKSDYECSSIDYVALEKNAENENILVFYEAKHFTNPEIRSNTTPKVLEQIARYEEALHLHEKEIIRSYNTVIQNLDSLHILSNRGFIMGNMKNLSIDFKPKLIIFGIDSNIKNWENTHKKKLIDNLGDRLILK